MTSRPDPAAIREAVNRLVDDYRDRCLTAFQRDICRRLAARRIASGESYVAGAPTPTALDLAGRWQAQLRAAREACALLPPACAGQAVLTPAGTLFKGDASDLRRALDQQTLLFHPGRLRGAFPRLRPE